MYSEYINIADSNEKAWLIAEYFVRTINGVINITNPKKGPDFESNLGLDAMFQYFEDKHNPDITPRNLHYREQIINPINNKLAIDKKHLSALSAIDQLFYLAIRREDFKDLFLIGGGELNWITLYQLLDTIMFYANNKFWKNLSKFNINKKEISLFKRTANSFGFLSFNSRHGVNRGLLNFVPMKYERAKELIQTICIIYLDQEIKNILS